jgi:peptide-methionine (S)-S-oxide reductase
MENIDIEDTEFRLAVEAIGTGDIATLEAIIARHPAVLQTRLPNPAEGYFKNPYLLWFVADNPIRLGKLPNNIVDMTDMLLTAVKRESPDSAAQQLDYTLELVATGRIPRECGVQIELIDLLIDAGAAPSSPLGALPQGNVEAANLLIERGAQYTLATAVGLNRMEDVAALAKDATDDEKRLALTVAAFYGNSSMVSFLLGIGANPNGFPVNNEGFHQHATPLHQAVSSASLDCVKLLAEAGGSLDARDKIFGGTPAEWAEYLQREGEYDEPGKQRLAIIYGYLHGQEGDK